MEPASLNHSRMRLAVNSLPLSLLIYSGTPRVSMRLSWSEKEVDEKLHTIMKNIHDNSAKAAEANGLGYNLVAGANIAGFAKVADAMIAQGII